MLPVKISGSSDSGGVLALAGKMAAYHSVSVRYGFFSVNVLRFSPATGKGDCFALRSLCCGEEDYPCGSPVEPGYRGKTVKGNYIMLMFFAAGMKTPARIALIYGSKGKKAGING